MPPPEPLRVLGEDGPRIYVWKPSGIPVFPPHQDPTGDCLLARILARWPERATGWGPGFEGGLAHRLDNATSGLVLLARTPPDLPALRADFREGRLLKRYRLHSSAAAAFVEKVVTVPLAHHPRKADRMVWERGPRTAHRGRWYPAWTRFEHIEGPDWRAEIRTGVTHQIRVHAAWAGIPLDGDPIYGLPGTGRFLLHHEQVIGPGWVSAVAPLPGD